MPQARRGPASRPRRNGCLRDRMAHPATGQPDDPRRHRRTGFSIVRATSWRIRPSRSGRALLCYHDEDTVGSWTKEQDAAVMKKLAVVQGGLTKQGRLGPVARLLPTTSATTLRKDDPPLVID